MTDTKKLAGLAPRRKQLGLTQAQLAAELQVERATLGMWEIGASWPPARILPRIADALLCSIDELYRTPGADQDERERWGFEQAGGRWTFAAERQEGGAG